MRKILKSLSLASLLLLLNLNIITVDAASLSSSESETQVCNREIHYYYFLLPVAGYPECYLDDPYNQVTCSTGGATQVTADDRYQALLDNDAGYNGSVYDTTFEAATLPEGYRLLSLETVANTQFTAQDYYLMFDFYVNKGTGKLTSEDTGNTVYSAESSGNVIVTEDSDGNKVYNHIHGSWSGGGEATNDNSIFDKISLYWSGLNTSQRVELREKTVNDFVASTLTTTATVGIQLENGSFQELSEDNMSRIFDAVNKVAIRRTIDTSNRPEEMMYYVDNGGTMRNYLAYAAPAKFRVEIGTDCHERTCEDVNAEYEACQADNSCSDELIKEYEACNPVEEVENPDTSEINIPLVCLVVTGMAVLAVSAYQQKKKDVK